MLLFGGIPKTLLAYLIVKLLWELSNNMIDFLEPDLLIKHRMDVLDFHLIGGFALVWMFMHTKIPS